MNEEPLIWWKHVSQLSPAGWLLIAINVSLGLNLSSAKLADSKSDEPKEEVCCQPDLKAALADAIAAEADEVSHELISLTPGAENTKWHDQYVLTAVFTDYAGYYDYVGRELKLSRSIWVTSAPELRDKCRGLKLKGDAIIPRLRQYLGLLPTGQQDRVVELWVRPADIFRPCADPEVTDRSCRLGLPEVPDVPPAPTVAGPTSTAAPQAPAEDPAKKQERDALIGHARWFKSQFDGYYGANAMPWTRLGYTYDWGEKNNHVGASEYVIREKALVIVSSVTAAQDYCNAEAALPPEHLPTPPRPPAAGAADGGTAD